MIALDSSFLVAFHNDRDHHHAAALPVMRDILAGRWGDTVLVEHVLVEVTTVIAARRDLETAVRVGRLLLDAGDVTFVPGVGLIEDAFEVFAAQGRRGLSFTDAALVAWCRRQGGGALATFDRGFSGLDGVEVVPA